MKKFLRGMFEQVPWYFRAKYQLISTVTFVAFFSLFSMIVSIPLSHNVWWFSMKVPQAIMYTVAFYVICLLVVIVSKRIMYSTRNTLRLNYLQYTIWCLAECLVICCLYTIFSFKGDEAGIIQMEDTTMVELFLNAFLYAFTSLFIPYLIAAMYFAIIDMTNTIRLINYENVVTDEPKEEEQDRKVTLFDNSGVLKFSVNLDNLYYIESDDNYIVVWYTDSGGDMKKYMIRCRLKTVEESFRDSSLVRCHRRYIVNMDKVTALRREKDGYELELGDGSIPPITITKTYAENVLKRFEARDKKQ